MFNLHSSNKSLQIVLLRNTRDKIVWTVGNGDPMHNMYFLHGFLAHGNSKGETKG